MILILPLSKRKASLEEARRIAITDIRSTFLPPDNKKDEKDISLGLYLTYIGSKRMNGSSGKLLHKDDSS